MPSARAQALILLPAETFAKRHSDPKRRSERSEESKGAVVDGHAWEIQTRGRRRFAPQNTS